MTQITRRLAEALPITCKAMPGAASKTRPVETDSASGVTVSLIGGPQTMPNSARGRSASVVAMMRSAVASSSRDDAQARLMRTPCSTG
jgi:hypothetical protein